MPFVQTNLAAEPRSFSIGPLRMQLATFAIVSGDTSGTVVADALSTLDAVIVTNLSLTAQPSISGNQATLAFADPVANRAGQIIMLGT